jgi:hypothetical protein
MRKIRGRPGGGRAPWGWLRPLLAGGALALLGVGHTTAFAAVVPTAAPVALPTTPPVALPTVPPVNVPPPPAYVPPPPVYVPPPVNVPPPPVNVPPPPVSVAPPPVNVPPPPVNVPQPPQQPLPAGVSGPVPTPNVTLPTALPDPSLPNPAGASGTPAAAGVAGAPALPSGLAPSGALPSGVTASGAAIDPSSGAAVSAVQGPLRLGEHDYSSAGSPTTFAAVDAAAAQRDPASQTPAQSAPMICPQLTFAPLVSGCESVLGPLNGPLGEGLAHTGTPIALGLAGLFFIGVGGLLYRRSSRREDDSATSPLRRLETR